MNKRALYAILAFLLISSSVLELTYYIPYSKATSSFTIKSAQIAMSDIQSGSGTYLADWSTKFPGANINTVRLTVGCYGDTWGININNNPSNWAQNLENFLTLITGKNRSGVGTSTGITKVWWQAIGDPWSGCFGMYSGQGLSETNPNVWDRTPCLVAYSNLGAGWTLDSNTNTWRYSLISSYEKNNNYPTTKLFLDKLAGNNSLSYNFLNDSRILAWSPFNEAGMGQGTGDTYSWVTTVMSYIHTKGGLTIADCPIYDHPDISWEISFRYTAPLFISYADYLETHNYCLTSQTYYSSDSLEAAFNSGASPTNAWDAWKNYVINDLTPQMTWANYYGWDANHVILGEFGIWVGNGSDVGFSYNTSDQNSADYVKNFYAALVSVGFKCVNYYCLTGFPASWGLISYGILIRNTDGTTITHGGYNELKAAYDSGTPPVNTFGTTTVGTQSTTFYSGIPRAIQYTPADNGTLTDIYLYMTGSGSGRHAKVGLYSDTGSNAPDTLLASSSSTEITSDGWQDFSGFSLSIINGTKYWLAFASDSPFLLIYYNNGGANYAQYNSNTYGSFPSSYGTPLYTGNYDVSIYGVYSTTGPTPSPTPSPTPFIQYYITVNSTYGSPTSSGWVTFGGTYSVGVTSPFTVNNKQYVCLGYSIDNNGSGIQYNGTSYSFNNVSSNHTITFYWQQYPLYNTRIISASASSGGVISPSGSILVTLGGSQTFTFTPNVGYEISQVQVNGYSIGAVVSYTFVNVTSDQSIYVSFVSIYSTAKNQNLTLFLRSDLYSFSGVSGYGLDTDYTNNATHISIVAGGNGNVTYGFRVYLLTSSVVSSELTNGVPEAKIYLASNFTGSISSSWVCPETSVTLGYQCLKVDVYTSTDSGGNWVNQATFITNELTTKKIESSLWTFTLNVNFTTSVSATNCQFSFGDSAYRSTVSGVTILTPNNSDLAAYRLSIGDLIGFIIGAYSDVIGVQAFYVLILFGCCAALYRRYTHFGVIAVFFILFAGPGGLLLLFIPTWAVAVAALLMILGCTFILWRLIK